MIYKFLCSHCGHKFESDVAAVKECPSCFWTTSVERADTAKEALKTPQNSTKQKNLLPKSSRVFLKIIFYAAVVLFILGAGFFVWSKFFSNSQNNFFISSSAIDFPNETKLPVVPGENISAVEAPEHSAEFTKVERPTDEDKTILNKTVDFKTGWNVNLPSPIWTDRQYQKFIADQETFYKIQFSKSYRKKLEELFRDKYLSGGEAFLRGDFLLARNAMVESLAFPLYSKDIEKHRAVALTMLKPFINDTLSKVSALNQVLAEQNYKNKEASLGREYQNLLDLISRNKFKEAYSLAKVLEGKAKELLEESSAQVDVPIYPDGFGEIDADLQKPLMELTRPRPVASAALQPLLKDVEDKSEILQEIL